MTELQLHKKDPSHLLFKVIVRQKRHQSAIRLNVKGIPEDSKDVIPKDNVLMKLTVETGVDVDVDGGRCGVSG